MEPQEIANKLGDIRANIAQLETEKKELEEQLLYALKMNGMKSIRTDYGETVSRVWKTTYKVKDKLKAMSWASGKGYVKTEIDTKKVNAVLARLKKLPAGFEKVDSEYLRMIKPGDNQDENVSE